MNGPVIWRVLAVSFTATFWVTPFIGGEGRDIRMGSVLVLAFLCWGVADILRAVGGRK